MDCHPRDTVCALAAVHDALARMNNAFRRINAAMEPVVRIADYMNDHPDAVPALFMSLMIAIMALSINLRWTEGQGACVMLFARAASASLAVAAFAWSNGGLFYHGAAFAVCCFLMSMLDKRCKN
jgi:hypothetical protein